MHKRLFAWDAADGRALLATKKGHQSAAVLPSTDGRSALLVTEIRQEWTVLSRLSLADAEPREVARLTHFNAAYVPRECAADLALTTVVLEQGEALVVVDAGSGTVLRRIALPGTVVALAASDDLRVVACLVDLRVRKRLEVWDARDGRLIAAEDQPLGAYWGTPLRVSPDGSSIAFARGVERRARDELVVWDVARWTPRAWPDSGPYLGAGAALDAHDASLTAQGTRTAALDPLTLDERRAPGESPDGPVEHGQLRAGARHPSPDRLLAVCADPPRAITVLSCAVLAVDIYESDSGNVDTASEIYLWDLASPESAPRLLERVERFWVSAAAFSPDGAWMGWLSPRGPIHLRDAATLEILESRPMPASILQDVQQGMIPTMAMAIGAGRRHWAPALGGRRERARDAAARRHCRTDRRGGPVERGKPGDRARVFAGRRRALRGHAPRRCAAIRNHRITSASSGAVVGPDHVRPPSRVLQVCSTAGTNRTPDGSRKMWRRSHL